MIRAERELASELRGELSYAARPEMRKRRQKSRLAEHRRFFVEIDWIILNSFG
jgi:hypothetical protein